MEVITTPLEMAQNRSFRALHGVDGSDPKSAKMVDFMIDQILDRII